MAEEVKAAATADTLPEIIVNIEPDPPPKVDNVQLDPAKDLAQQYKALEEQSKADKADRDAAQARADAAARDADAARREAQAANERASNSSLDTINTALASAQSSLDSAKAAHKAAREAGNYEEELEAQDRMTQARIDIRTYDEAKVNIESRKTQRQEQPTSTDPVEAYVARRSEPTARWLRAHKDYILDPDKNNELTAAHYSALSKRLAPDTQAYFDHVEKTLGLSGSASTGPVTEGDDVQRPGAAKETKKAAPRAVAPVNGASGSGGPVSKNTVTLTSGEAKAAVDGTHIWNYDDPSGQKKFKRGEPIGVEEFARRKKAMTDSGQYDRTYDTQ